MSLVRIESAKWPMPRKASHRVSWFGVTSELLEKARQAVLDMPSTVFLRSADALHLACAQKHGFQDVYTNDGHMLKAAGHFHLTGVNVLGDTD